MAGSVLYDFFACLGLMTAQVIINFVFLLLTPLIFVVERYRSRKNVKQFNSIFITGGNSGLGEHLAYEFAKPGVHLTLVARDAARLKDVAAKCSSLGADVDVVSCDVTDQEKMRTILLKADADKPLDLVIANAGVSHQSLGGKETFATNHKAIVDINIHGVQHTLEPIMTKMRERKQGQLVIMSSLAGIISLPDMANYSMTKRAVAAYGQGLRHLLAFDNVGLTTIHPGFVRSRMTDHHQVKGKSMPFFMEADQAARIMVDGIQREVAQVVFPWPLHVICHIVAGLPAPIFNLVASLTTSRKAGSVFLGRLAEPTAAAAKPLTVAGKAAAKKGK
jgi:short-subunit dehydrogenase